MMCIPGRYITECTRNTYDIFSQAKARYLPGMLLMIDFDIVFDSVSFKFIITTLEMFGFGEYFIKWITIILCMKDGANFHVVTDVNGNISNPFLVMEVLALMLAKENIKPYRTANGIEHLLDIYADDLTIYLENNRKSNWCNREKCK